MNAIKWISAEAKKIRRAHPKKYKKWTQYIREASNKYAREKKPAGRKKAAPRRRRLGVSTVPAGLPLYSPRKKVMAGARKKGISHKRLKAPPKFNYSPGDANYLTFPRIPWYNVKDNNIAFTKVNGQYYTLRGQLIVWSFGEGRTAQAWLKKHCLKSK